MARVNQAFRIAVLLASVLIAGPLPGHPGGPPAGQECPPGAYVRGFDADGNILCTGLCGTGVLDAGESCDDGNVLGGDGCSAACTREGAPAAAAGATAAAQAAPPAPAPAAAPATAAQPAMPVIEDVEPSSVVYGTRELELTVIGSGFEPGAVVTVAGKRYEPVVDADGRRLRVTVPTRSLTIGAYPVKVSNGPGREATRKRGLVVY